MKIFNIFNKNKQEKVKPDVFRVEIGKKQMEHLLSNNGTTVKKTKANVDMEHLTDEGELPWGWLYQNKDFVDRINNEYSYFLDTWLESRSKSPYEHRNALKSFVIYLDDVENLCRSKGECFEFWFRHILTSERQMEIIKADLAELCDGIEKKQEMYNERQYLLPKLDTMVAEKLIENEGILQSEFVKLFNPVIENEVRERLYVLEKEGIIERVKAGRSYALLIKK
jgi:hypothetical protein